MNSYTGSILYNRREHPRADLELKVDFRIHGYGTVRERTTTKTVGEGGLMFISSVLLSVGMQLEIQLYYHRLVIPFVAEVVWIEQLVGTELSDFKCGLKYVEIAHDDLMHIHYILQSSQQKNSQYYPNL